MPQSIIVYNPSTSIIDPAALVVIVVIVDDRSISGLFAKPSILIRNRARSVADAIQPPWASVLVIVA
jgi:hypothetical protein